jgi:hypothetical protein
METLTQCCMKRKTEHGDITQTSWIPSKFAKLDEYVKLKENGAWTDGWRVVAVYDTMPAKFIAERTQDYKNMKKMTDI